MAVNSAGEQPEAVARHVPWAYVVAAVEAIAGIGMSLFAAAIGLQMSQSLAHAELDDKIAASSIAIAGVCVAVSGVVTLFHCGVSYGLLRRVRVAAIASEALLMAAAVVLWFIAKRRGGDWAGLGLLGAMLLGAIGTILLLLSLFGLRVLRRLRVPSSAVPRTDAQAGNL